jgi:hypothetical protein
MAMLAKSPAEVIAGEATSGSLQARFQDMLHIASVMVNRATLTGTSLKSVVSAPGQFNAYNAKMPAGTRSLVGLAQAAINQVQKYGAVTDATFYATPAAVDKLPSGLNYETETAGHIYKSDPLNRGIKTAVGTIVPDPSKLSGFQAKMVTTQPVTPEPVNPVSALENQIGYVPGLASVQPNVVSPISVAAMPNNPVFSNGMLTGDYPAGFTSTSQPTQNFAQGLADRVVAGQTGIASPEQVSMDQSVARQLADMQAARALQAETATSPSLPDANASLSAGMAAQRDYADPGTQTSRLAGNVAQTADPARMNVSDSTVASVNRALQDAIDRTLATPARQTVSSFPAMAAAAPMAAPADVNAAIAAMQTPNLAASASVPLAAALFSPAVAPAQEQAQATPDMTTAMGVTATNDSLIGTQPGTMGTLATKDFDLGPMMPAANNFADLAAAGPTSIGVPADPNASLGNMASGMQAQRDYMTADPARLGAPSAVDQVMATPTSYIDTPSAVQAPSLNTWSDVAAAAPVGSYTNFTSTSLPTGQSDLATGNFDPSRIAATSAVDKVMQTPQSYMDAPAAIDPSIAAGYQQMADTGYVGGITDLSGNTLVGPTGVATPNYPASNLSLPANTSLLSSSTLESQTPSLSVPSLTSSMLAPSVTPNYQQFQSFVPDDTQPVSDPNVSLETPAITATAPFTSPLSVQPAVTSQITAPSFTSSLTSPNNSLSGTQSTPMHTAQDVWSGTATTGIATDGSTVSRMQDGTVGRYNPEFDHTEFTNPDGSYGGMKKGNVLGAPDPNASLSKSPTSSISGTTSPTSSLSSGMSRLSNSIFSGGTVGSIAGSLLGAALAGPIGGLALGILGQKLGGKYLGDQVPDESPMRSLFGLLSGAPAPGASATGVPDPDGGVDYGMGTPGGGGGVTGTSSGPGGGGGHFTSPGLF